MFEGGTDDNGGGAQPLLLASLSAPTTTTSNKPAGFKLIQQIVLSIRFLLICLNRTRSPLPLLHTPIDDIIPLEEERAVIDDIIPSEEEKEVIDIARLEKEREMKKDRLKEIVKEKNLAALETDFCGVGEAVSFLHSQWDTQIDAIGDLAQTGFWDSLLLFLKAFWSSLYNSFNSSTILLLVFAAGFSLAIGSIEQGLKHGWHDCVGILLAVFLLLFFSSVLGFCKKKAEEKKRLKIKNNFKVTVKRHEELQEISVFDVKEGEIIHLKKGDRVLADGLLIKGNNLILDEAINSHIDPRRNPFLLSGSVVEYGEGEMLAVSIDRDTAFWKGLLDVIVYPSQETLFQSRINKPYEFF